jgi:PAS domain S-box-containing protein
MPISHAQPDANFRTSEVRWMDLQSVISRGTSMRPTTTPATTTNHASEPIGGFGEQHMRICFEAFLDDAGCAVAICDTEGRIHFANRAVMECVGMDASQAPPIGKTLHDIIPAQTAEVRLELIRRALSDPEGAPQVGLCATDGAWRRLAVRALDRTPGAERAVLVCAPLAQAVTMNDLVGPHQAFCTIAVDLGPLAHLTEREMQVLRLIGLGLSTQEIADRLHRSKKTIEWHRVSLGSKLDVTNRVELARLALRAGLTWFDEDAITHVWRNAARNGHPPRDEE